MIGPLSYLDAGLLAVCLISAMLAMYRGFAREVLSILSWLVAAGVTFFVVFTYKGIAEDLAKQVGTPVQVAQIAIGAVLFLIVLISVHLITSRLSDVVLESSVGMIDRILGFGFGLARGFLLVVIPFLFYTSFIPDETKQFTWVRNAISAPYLKATGNSIRGLLEQHMPSTLTQPSAPPSNEAPAQ